LPTFITKPKGEQTNMSIAVIYGSTRLHGNTEQLTEYVIKGLEVEKIFLRDFLIQPIDDRRHAEGGFQPVDDDYSVLVERMMKHDTFIFATPIYWYSMSGTMKNFIDRWSHTMRDEKFPGFKKQLGTQKARQISCLTFSCKFFVFSCKKGTFSCNFGRFSCKNHGFSCICK
jgi:putative NADPH-quinone reductase